MRRMNSRALAWGVLGGLLAGTLDIVYATSFWALRDVPAQRIFQSISAGLLGRAAFSGGWPTAALGLSLHYLIAATMGFAYAFAARDVPRLREHPWRYGALYGLALYALMSFVVVPLSAAPRGGSLPMSWTVCSVIAHVVVVGWPCAWFARRGWDNRWWRSSRSSAFALSTT